MGHHKPDDIKELWMLLQRTKSSASAFPNKEQVHFRLGSGHRAHSDLCRSTYRIWWMKELHKHLQAPAGALSTDKGLHVQKELFIRGTDIPAAAEEQAISPTSNGWLLTSKSPWLRRVYSHYLCCISRAGVNWYLDKLEEKQLAVLVTLRWGPIQSNR